MNLIDALKETGKARRKSWLNSKYRVFPDNERRCFKAVDSNNPPYFIDMSFESIVAEDWEPYIEPCKHEPSVLMSTTQFTTYMDVCEECGAKIKATGWEAL